MVEVAATVEVVTRVGISGRFGLSGGICHLIIAAYPLQAYLPGLAVPLLYREIIPVGHTITMIDHNILYEACPFCLVGGNHGKKFLLCAESGIMVSEPILRHISHISTFTGVRHPYKFEILR